MNTQVAVGGRALDDLQRLARLPYLLIIAGFIVVAQWLGAFVYNEWARYVASAYKDLTERAPCSRASISHRMCPRC